MSRKSEGGERYLLAYKAVTDGSFNGVLIVHSSAKADKEINKSQFYQALVYSISAPLMPESETHN